MFAPSRCILLRVWTIYKNKSEKVFGELCEAYKAYFGTLLGIKTSPGHLNSHANIARKLLKVRWTIAACLDVPTPPKRDQPPLRDSSKSDSEEDIGDPYYVFTDAVKERRPYFPNQKDVNDQIRDLGVTKSNAELLISRLKQWNLLDESVQITDQRKCHETFSNFFSRQDGLGCASATMWPVY